MSEPAPAALTATSIADLVAFYDARYPGRVGMGRRPALLVVDFSIAFTRGFASFPGGGYEAELVACARLLDAVRGRDLPALFTTIAYSPDATDVGLWAVKVPWIRGLREGRPEVEIDPVLARRPEEPLLVKKYPSAFFETDLDRRLRRDGVDTLILAGCTTSLCVRATAVDGMQLGYRVLLAADAINDFHPALHAVHLADLGGRYGDVLSVDTLIGLLPS